MEECELHLIWKLTGRDPVLRKIMYYMKQKYISAAVSKVEELSFSGSSGRLDKVSLDDFLDIVVNQWVAEDKRWRNRLKVVYDRNCSYFKTSFGTVFHVEAAVARDDDGKLKKGYFCALRQEGFQRLLRQIGEPVRLVSSPVKSLVLNSNISLLLSLLNERLETSLRLPWSISRRASGFWQSQGGGGTREGGSRLSAPRPSASSSTTGTR